MHTAEWLAPHPVVKHPHCRVPHFTALTGSAGAEGGVLSVCDTFLARCAGIAALQGAQRVPK